jgi:hypothetical protein
LQKVNSAGQSQRKKSTLVNGKVNGQRWSKSTVNARADVAVACLGLTWRPGGVTRGREEVWRVGARDGAPDLQAAREGASDVGIRRFLFR